MQYAPGFKHVELLKKYELTKKELIQNRYVHSEIDRDTKDAKLHALTLELASFEAHLANDMQEDDTKKESTSFVCPYCGNKMTVEFIEKARYCYVPMGPSVWYACHSCGSKSPSIFLDEKLLDEGKIKAAVEREIEKAKNGYEDEFEEETIYD